MPVISPLLNALVYRGTPTGASGSPAQIGSLLAPPYDVVDAGQRQSLLAHDPDNIVSIDVPRLPATTPGPSHIYAQARVRLDTMRRRGILRCVQEPAILLLRQTFRKDDQIHRRRAILAGVPIGPTGSDLGLFGHEEFTPGPKGDRLALLDALDVQTSPIFGLYSDEDGAVEDEIRRQCLYQPLSLVGRSPDGTLNELWMVKDESLVSDMIRSFGSRDMIIADGQHRYQSLLTHLERLGEAPPGHPARFCLMALVAHQDPGMSIRPIHQVVHGMNRWSVHDLRSDSHSPFHLTASPGPIDQFVERIYAERFEGSHAIGLIDVPSKQMYVLASAAPDPLAQMTPDRPDIWRTVDQVIYNTLLCSRVLPEMFNAGRPIERHYLHSMEAVKETLAAPGDAQLILIYLPIALRHVLRLAVQGLLLPADSTFFWPKIPSGLVLKSLEPS